MQALRSSLVYVMVIACDSPAPAPTTFDDLCAFVFEHGADEDDQQLGEGTENLTAWLTTRQEEVGQGYLIENLDPAWVEQHEDKLYDLTGLIGVAHAMRFEHSLKRLLARDLHDDETTHLDEQGRIAAKRSYNSPHQCFIQGACDYVSYDTQTINHYPLGIEAVVQYRSEFRRFQTALGEAVIVRTWLTAPSDFNWDWIELDLSYVLTLMVEIEPGLVERTEATWMLGRFADAPMPLDMALALVLDTMKTNAANLRASLDAEHADENPANP